MTSRAVALAVGGLLALVVVGCTDDGSGRAPAAPTTTTTSPRIAPTTLPPRGEPIGSLGGSRHLAWLANLGTGGRVVVVQDLETGAIRRVAADEGGLASPVVTADGGTVAWIGVRPDLEPTQLGLLVRGPGDDEPRPIGGPHQGACPSWLPDGDLLVSAGHRRLARVDPADGELEELPVELPEDLEGCALAAGPDHAVYVRPTEEPFGAGAGEIVRVGLDGTGEEVVGDLPPGCRAHDVTASVDGTRLAVGSECEDPARTGLYLGTTAGDDLALAWTGNTAGADDRHAVVVAVGASWSADGTTVVFQRALQGVLLTSEVWALDVAASVARPLAVTPGGAPALSPPG